MQKTSYRDYVNLKRGDIVEFEDGSEFTVLDSTETTDGCSVIFNQAKLFVSPSDKELRWFKLVGYHNLQPMKRL